MSQIDSYSPPKIESTAAASTPKGDCGMTNEIARQQIEFRGQATAVSRCDVTAMGSAYPQSLDFGASGDIYQSSPDASAQKSALTYQPDNGANSVDTQRDQVSSRFCRVGIDLESQHANDLSEAPQGWANALHQTEIYGKAICAGVESYQHNQMERAWGSLIGTVQGVGDIAVGLSTLADFTAALILNDQNSASKMGADFGNAVGDALVAGVHFCNATDQYLFNIGYTSDYAKPFRDVMVLGQKLNDHWNSLSPREQERQKSQFITNLVASAVVTEAGIGAIKKASSFTDMLDAAACNLKDATLAGTKKAANVIGQAVDTVLQPVGDTGTGFNMPIPKSPENADNLIAKMTKPAGEEPIGSKVEPTGRAPESADSKPNDAPESRKPTEVIDAKLPPFDSNGNLPPGIHECSLNELEQRFATNPGRRDIFSHLVKAIDELKEAGCKKVYVNGSFTTSKVNPGDFDICFDATGMDISKLNPILENPKIFGEEIKMHYGGDIKLYNPGDWKNNWLNFFQRDGRAGGIRKGIVLLTLGETP